MQSIKIAIVEDEFLIAASLQSSLTSLGYRVIKPVGSYNEAISLLESELPDLIFLDIQLKGEKDGVDLAFFINEKYKIPFIFLTANSDQLTVNRAKESHPSAFLIKPFQKQELFASIEVALFTFRNRLLADSKQTKIEPSDSLFIKDGYFFHKVRFDEILYLESDDVYVNVVTIEGKKILVRSSLKQYFSENFEDRNFFRIGRSHIINLKHLDGIDPSYVLVKGRKLPLGRNYREELLAFLNISS